MRVLLAFEEEYRTYMEAMQAAIRAFRPEVEVLVAAAADAEELAAALERADPQLVICNCPPTPDNLLDARLAQIELSLEPDQPSRFRVGERSWESTNPTLGEILPVIVETKKLLRTPRRARPKPKEGLLRGVDALSRPFYTRVNFAPKPGSCH